MTDQASVPPCPFPDVRIVVTGHDEKGAGSVRNDSKLELQDAPGGKVRSVSAWITDDTPTPDCNLDIDGGERKLPGIGLVHPRGTNFRYTDMSPEVVIPMHRTTSIDYNILIRGELILQMENGDERHLKAGDVVIQRGSLHGWRNPSNTEWARLLSVLIDAVPAKPQGENLLEEWRG